MASFEEEKALKRVRHTDSGKDGLHNGPSWKQDGVLSDESKDWAFGGTQYVNGEVEN